MKKVPWTLVRNGKYTADVKAMARALHKAGCSQGKVGEMIQYVAQKAGFLVAHKMSRRTVQRALIEGPLRFNWLTKFPKRMVRPATASGDATSLRGHNYESSHIMITKNGEHKNRILGISSTVDHTSETQVNNWKRLLATITDLFRRCPLAQRSEFSFELTNFLRLFKGMNGDHASDQKKTVRLMIEWKKEVSRILLGWDEIHAMDPAEILVIVSDICVQNVAEAGGEDAWKALPDTEKDTLAKSSMDALALHLGQAAFEKLSEEEKREIDLFFWAGCSMHKELNSCKAFTDGMESYYIANDIEGPVLLANKDNDATIQLSQDTGLSTAAVQRALKVSERGAVKLIGLLGAFVNHKDPKKGCHDVYDDYFRPLIGDGVRFPGVNNTRYQSFGLGGARIISFLDEHKLFMSFVKNKKQKRTLNHLEQNIVKGMNCPKTIAEIIAFVLYCMAVTHPYALRVRGLGTEKLNILTLGPFHVQVKDHIRKVIASPELLLSSAPDAHGDATLDGAPWSDPTAHAACMKLLPTHPDVKPLLLAGLRSSLECWERFTSEFEEGGVIDLASDAEKDLAFMASTNDANEGLLGQWRRFSRESPSSTVAHFEDQAMFSRNETQAFMDEHLASEADQDFLRREARARDESGIEKARRAELTAHAQKAVDEQLAKDAKNTEKERIKAARLAAIGIKLDTVEINAMNNDALKDQLNIHRRRGDKEVPIAARLKYKADRLAALLAAVARFTASQDYQPSS
ncbi:hypothetical protein GGX14DRAFT_526945 [Mycena pura]|uniref:Uncharacterized protein n=1 Tax=Mycena pura TaxID=153505 RepID=A0AAD6Y135_9AGAR|nr:hypothetical protein GGX14DRAFT_526945 [Mycena pura]